VRSRRIALRLIPLAALSVIPLGLSLTTAKAGDLKARITGAEHLRPSALASATAADKKLYTLREFDPLVPAKYTTISAKPDKDITLAIYGAGDKSAFGLGAVIRLAGGRAVPATVVVPSGVSVFFRNDDPFIHRIVGPDVDRELKPGESHKFEPKGKNATYTDSMIPSVKAFVAIEDGVIANRWPAPDGTIKITELSDGEYTVKAFFEGQAKTANTFKIPAKGVVEIKEPIAVATAASGK